MHISSSRSLSKELPVTARCKLRLVFFSPTPFTAVLVTSWPVTMGVWIIQNLDVLDGRASCRILAKHITLCVVVVVVVAAAAAANRYMP